MGVFDLNEEVVVIRESFMGSNIYYIDDFYKNPDAVVETFNNKNNDLHDPIMDNPELSINGIQFEDRRHKYNTEELKVAYDRLSEICCQKPVFSNTRVITNQVKFFKNDFNNYKDNYWHPHIDVGYNGIVYLNNNENDISGTNLYRKIKPDLPYSRGEHVDPWRSKQNWELITTLKPAYNRCVLFDGVKFHHGMHICDDMYFGDEYRLNQVFFFQDPDYHEDPQDPNLT